MLKISKGTKAILKNAHELIKNNEKINTPIQQMRISQTICPCLGFITVTNTHYLCNICY